MGKFLFNTPNIQAQMTYTLVMNPQSNPQMSVRCTLPVEPPPAVVPNLGVLATDEAPPPPMPTNAESAATIIREQDRLMPVANVSRIMRQVLPPYAKISDDAKEVIQDCVSEFISFVTGEANERCHAERRKTVTSEDIVWAMNRLGFDDYVAPVSAFLLRMRESEAGGEERGGGGGGGGGGGPGRGHGSRRGSSVVTLPLNNGAVAAVCRHPPQQGVPPPAAYAAAVQAVPRPVPVLVPASGAAPHPHFGVAGRFQLMVHGGDRRAVIPCYGGGVAFVVHAGGSQHVGFHADEASSSNENPPPPAGRSGSH